MTEEENINENEQAQKYLELLKRTSDTKRESVFETTVPEELKSNFAFIKECINIGCRLFAPYRSLLKTEHVEIWQDEQHVELLQNDNISSYASKIAYFDILPEYAKGRFNIEDDNLVIGMIRTNPKIIFDFSNTITNRILNGIFDKTEPFVQLDGTFDKKELIKAMIKNNHYALHALDAHVAEVCTILGYDSGVNQDIASYIGSIEYPSDYSIKVALDLFDVMKTEPEYVYNRISHAVKCKPEVVEKALSVIPERRDEIIDKLREAVCMRSISKLEDARKLKQIIPNLFQGIEAYFSYYVRRPDDSGYSNHYACFKDDEETLIESDNIYNFKLDQLFAWEASRQSLSDELRKEPIPKEHVIKAIGGKREHVEAFYKAQGENSVFAYLEETEFYKKANEYTKIEIIKLFAHLGCFEPGAEELKESQRLALREEQIRIIDDVSAFFTAEQIHSLFGGLPRGFSLEHIIVEQDENQNISKKDRDRYDKKGREAAKFFMNSIRIPMPEHPNVDDHDYYQQLEKYKIDMSNYIKRIDEFKEVASYALTSFVNENAKLAGRLHQAQKALDFAADQSTDPRIMEANKRIRKVNEEIINYIENNDKEKLTSKEEKRKYNRELAELEQQKAEARKELMLLIETSKDDRLIRSLEEVKRYKHPFCISDVKESFALNSFPQARISRIAEAAVAAGYKSAIPEDVKAVNILCDMYEAALAAPEKYFAEEVNDVSQEKERFSFYWPKKNPQDVAQLAVIAKTVGENGMSPCMRPFHQNESALWEAMTSRTVKVGFILDGIVPVAYVRVNYDDINKGIYIDVVESRKNIVISSNNPETQEDVWKAIKRGVVALAEKTHAKGEGYEVKVVNFRYDSFNRLPKQFEALPAARLSLRGRMYHDNRAENFTYYGTNDAREQREVWVNPEYIDEGGKIR